MPIIIPTTDFEQGSDRWMDAKLGIPSSSHFGEILTSTGKESATRPKYLKKLVNERITRRREKQWELSAFNRGKEMEPESRLYAENILDVEIEQVALVYKDERKRFLCSPDGLIGLNGGFETKDADVYIQAERLAKGTLPSIHFAQVQGCLYVTEREYWIYQSYCAGMRKLTIRVHRDEKWIKKLAIELELFCQDLDREVERLRNA
jgi:hypothetical protein